jgi:hypothetical protein
LQNKIAEDGIMGFEPLKPLSQNLLPLPIVKGKVIDEKEIRYLVQY